MIIVTMTTVGFGDYVPYTTLGKIVTMITALWGAFIISLLIVSVSAIFTLSPKQKVAYEKLVRVRTAAKCIISAMRYHAMSKKLKDSDNLRSSKSIRSSIYISESIVVKYRKVLEKNIKKFKEISKSVKISNERSLVTNKLNKIESRVENLEKMMVKSIRMLTKLSTQKENIIHKSYYSKDNHSDMNDSLVNHSPSRVGESPVNSPAVPSHPESLYENSSNPKEKLTARFQTNGDDYFESDHSENNIYIPIEEEKEGDSYYSINSEVKVSSFNFKRSKNNYGGNN